MADDLSTPEQSASLPNHEEDGGGRSLENQEKSRPPLTRSRTSLLDSISESNSSSLLNNGGASVTSRPSLDEIHQLSVEELITSKPKSGKPKSSKSNGSPTTMKKFNALLPKFKTNKLEPINVDPSLPSTSADYVGPIGTLPTASPRGSRKKPGGGKKLKRANKGGGKHKKAKPPDSTSITVEAAAAADQSAALIVPGTSGTSEIASIHSADAAGAGAATIQVLEVDASELRHKNKVIFAVPQYPGQPVIPIAYKLTNRKPSNVDGNPNGFQPPGGGGLLMNDLHFEVVWRNLIYYHQSTLKKLREAQVAEKKKNKSQDKVKLPKEGKQAALKGKRNSTKSPTGGPPPGNTIPAHRMSIVPRNGQPRPTLNNISGSFRSGQMTAIMGPSGAGKTVFLNCITGHLRIGSAKENSGDILINGVKTIRIGFVEQFDHLLPQLTVRESLLFASRIKNAARYYLNHMKIVENVISRLDLAECSESYTSQCSNGQRKRLSIAIELCFNSDILILDEPTTGLDAVTGFQIMNTLKALTKRRRAISILATIHQPSPRMFALFDNVVVLSREGTIMYQGAPADLPQTLQLVGLTCPMYTNISDFILEVASGDFGRQTLHLLSHYNKEYNTMRIAEDLNEVELTSLQEAVKRANSINNRSFVLCTWLLFIRTIVCNWRNPFNTQIRIVSLLFTGIFLGLVFTDVVGSVSTCPPTKYFLWRFEMDSILEETERQQRHAQENLGIVFMLAMVSLFNSMLNTVVTFAEELAVFRREHDNYSYSIFCFYIAKILGDMPFTLPSTALFVAAIHRMTGQIFEKWSRLGYAVLPCVMVTFLGQLVGMTIACIFGENVMASVFSVIFIIIPLIMFSGFFRLIVDMSWFMAKLSWISFLKQVVNALMIALYGFGRCEHENAREMEHFLARNITEEQARPKWITSMMTLINYQLMMSDSEDPNLVAIKNDSLGPEEKLVRYMGLNMGADQEMALTPLILQHFNLGITPEKYWYELSILSHYIVLFGVVLYAVMWWKYTRRV